MLGLQQEVQTITIESAATDTFTPLGFFVVTFEGRSSIPISPTATAWEMQRALEGVLTIDSVHVEVQDIPTASEVGPPYFLRPGHHGRRWTITFTGQPFDLPSMLVSTRAGGRGADLFATAGTLGGTAPMVSVETVSNGGLPTSFIASVPSAALNTKQYFVRVSAFNGIGWSRPVIAPLAVQPTEQPPSAPTSATVTRLDDSHVAVSWSAPERDGGGVVSKYGVQWSTDVNFDGDSGSVVIDSTQAAAEALSFATTTTDSSISMSASVDISPFDKRQYSFVIDGLPAGTPHYVRVLAYNRVGYSEPREVDAEAEAEPQQVVPVDDLLE